jgi:hypothetical protein
VRDFPGPLCTTYAGGPERVIALVPAPTTIEPYNRLLWIEREHESRPLRNAARLGKVHSLRPETETFSSWKRLWVIRKAAIKQQQQLAGRKLGRSQP